MNRSAQTLALAAVIAATGCAERGAEYRFRAPLLSSVRAEELPPLVLASAKGKPAPPARQRRSAEVQRTAATRPRPAATSAAPRHPPEAPDEETPPRRAAPSIADLMRDTVGDRDRDRTHLEFARDLLGHIGIDLDDEVRKAADSTELLAVAARREALANTLPLPGDLVVFARGVGRSEPEGPLIGVIVGAVEQGGVSTVEFVYLAARVVRRGYLTRSAPGAKRDASGRILNTFMRHRESRAPEGTVFLAGQLFQTYLRSDRLSRR